MGIVSRRNFRTALRKGGLRPITIWVPDTQRESFAEECRRQSLNLRNDMNERKILEQLLVVADTEGWK